MAELFHLFKVKKHKCEECVMGKKAKLTLDLESFHKIGEG